jgi:hypothetical protein
MFCIPLALLPPVTSARFVRLLIVGTAAAVASVPLCARAQSGPQPAYTLSIIALTGTAAPGGGTFGGINASPSLNDLGAVAFEANFTPAGGGPAQRGVFLRSTGASSAIALATSADAIPGAGGGTLGDIGNLALNNLGTAAFYAQVVNGTSGGGILSAGGPVGGLTPVALEGTPAPGGEVYRGIGNGQSPDINGGGTVTFGAATAFAPTRSGVYARTGSAPAVRVAGTGDVVPGVGTLVDIFSGPPINTAGGVAFQASLEGQTGYNPVLRYTAGAGVSLVAAAGAPVAGGGTFTGGSGLLGINTAGSVVMNGSVDYGAGALDAVVVADAGGGGLRKVAARGDSAAGVGFFSGYFQGAPSINDPGDVAFLAYVERGVTTSSGVYSSAGGDGVLRRVVGLAEEFAGSTISDLRLSRTSLNDSGQIAFRFALSDGRSGIGLATPTFVSASAPEPSALTLASVGATSVALYGRQRRKRARGGIKGRC